MIPNKLRDFIGCFSGRMIYMTNPDNPSRDGITNATPIHYFPDSLDEVYEALQERNGFNWGVFFAVNELDPSLDPEHKRTEKMVSRCRAVFLEDDQKRSKPRDDFPIKPSIIVGSSDRKFHYYWLTSTSEFQEWKDVQNRIIQNYHGDIQCKDLPRVLRLPTFNHGKRDPFESTVHIHSKTPYSWDQITKAFEPLPLESKKYSEHLPDSPPSGDFDEIFYIDAFRSGDAIFPSMNSLLIHWRFHYSKEKTLEKLENLFKSVPLESRDAHGERYKAAYIQIDTQLRTADKTVRESRDEGEQLFVSTEDLDNVVRAPVRQAPTLDPALAIPNDDFGLLVKSIINSTDNLNNPIAALNEALALVSLVSDVTYSRGGRAITTYYGVNVGKTFCGKSVTRESVMYHLSQASVDSSHIQESLSTFEAIEDFYMDSISSRPALMFNPDEIGFVFEALKKFNQSTLLLRFILSAYSLPYGPYKKRKKVGDKDLNQQVVSPKFVIMGGTTIEKLKNGNITKSEVESGQLNRMVFMNVEDYVTPKEEEFGESASPLVVDILKNIWENGERSMKVGGDVAKVGGGREKFSIKIGVDPDAAHYLNEARKKSVTDKIDNLYGRRVRNVGNIAGLRAIFVNPDEPRITLDYLKWAEILVDHSLKFLQYLFEVHLSETDAIGKEQSLIRILDVHSIIRKADAFAKASWHNGFTSEQRNRALDNMIKEGSVKDVWVRTSSGQKAHYIARGDLNIAIDEEGQADLKQVQGFSKKKSKKKVAKKPIPKKPEASREDKRAALSKKLREGKTLGK